MQQEKKQFDVNPHMMFVINPDTGEVTYSKLSAKVCMDLIVDYGFVSLGGRRRLSGGAGKRIGVVGLYMLFPNE